MIFDKMKKTKLIFISIAIVATALFWWLIFPNQLKQTSLPQEEPEVSQPDVQEEVILVINKGEGEPENFKVEFKEGITAFNLLKNKTEELDLTLKTKTYDIGVMIEAIGDKENGQDGKYWLYYVNNEMPMVSADKKEIKAGDKVEFKFETP